MFPLVDGDTPRLPNEVATSRARFQRSARVSANTKLSVAAKLSMTAQVSMYARASIQAELRRRPRVRPLPLAHADRGESTKRDPHFAPTQRGELTRPPALRCACRLGQRGGGVAPRKSWSFLEDLTFARRGKNRSGNPGRRVLGLFGPGDQVR